MAFARSLMSLLLGGYHRGFRPPEDTKLPTYADDSDGIEELSKTGARVNCTIRKSMAKLRLAARKVRIENGSPLATAGNLLGKGKSMVFLGVRRERVLGIRL